MIELYRHSLVLKPAHVICVDGAVRRLETAYDTGGRAYLFTSYNASSGGSIVNQVQQEYNGFSQLTKEWQAGSSGEC